MPTLLSLCILTTRCRCSTAFVGKTVSHPKGHFNSSKFAFSLRGKKSSLGTLVAFGYRDRTPKTSGKKRAAAVPGSTGCNPGFESLCTNSTTTGRKRPPRTSRYRDWRGPYESQSVESHFENSRVYVSPAQRILWQPWWLCCPP